MNKRFETTNKETMLNKARRLSSAHLNQKINGCSTPDDMYVVWFCKTLQNWKALVSTDYVDGMYYEVTYNGDKKETYVDLYTKTDNQRVVD